jgi:hypothetical protein
VSDDVVSNLLLEKKEEITSGSPSTSPQNSGSAQDERPRNEALYYFL